MSSATDVAIVGGGVSGLSAAISCAGAGLNTTLVSATSRDGADLPETLDVRVLPLLRSIGVDVDLIRQEFPSVTNRISRWGMGRAQIMPAMASAGAASLLVDKRRLVGLLTDAAQKLGIRSVRVDGLSKASENAGSVDLQFECAHKSVYLSAGFAIDATGRSAAMARQLGATRHHLDRLISFWIEGPAEAQCAQTTASVTSRDGWFFFASTRTGSASIGFFSSGRILKGKPEASDILDRVLETAEVASLIKDIEIWRISPVTTRNAASTMLWPAGGRRWLACGDALQTFDPLSSSGLRISIEQGVAAASEADRVLRGGLELSGTDYVRKALALYRSYSDLRKAYYGGEGPVRPKN